LGKLDVAIIEVTAVLEDGRMVPASSMGNNKPGSLRPRKSSLKSILAK
jgi:acyl-CoA hydrolase